MIRTLERTRPRRRLVPIVGPHSHGKRMSLGEFARAETEPGYLYELYRGVIVVMPIPGVPHERGKDAFRKALYAYDQAHPGRIDLLADGSGCAVRIPGRQTERHPDLAIYLSPPPVDDEQAWDFWTPDIVIEVVSEGGERRDYEEKREDYLQAGVRLYWIFDRRRRTATVLTRRGDQWDERKLDESGVLETPLLPGFRLKLSEVFSVVPKSAQPAARRRPRRNGDGPIRSRPRV